MVVQNQAVRDLAAWNEAEGLGLLSYMTDMGRIKVRRHQKVPVLGAVFEDLNSCPRGLFPVGTEGCA